MVDGAIDGVVFIYLLALRLPFIYLPFILLFRCIYLFVSLEASIYLLTLQISSYSVVYQLAWMESTVSLLVAFILYDIFDQLHRAWISFISIVICSHSFLVPSLVGLNSLNIGCLSMVTDYSVRLAVRRLHH